MAHVLREYVIKYILIECWRDNPVLVHIAGRLRKWLLKSTLFSNECEGFLLDKS